MPEMKLKMDLIISFISFEFFFHAGLTLDTFQVVSKSQTNFLQSEKNLKSLHEVVARSHDLGCLVYDGQKLSLFQGSLFFVFLI